MGAKKIRALIAKPGLDGHDVGAKVVVRALIDAGCEVIYTGLKKSPEEIANIARDEDVDVIGLSILSGSHLPLCRDLKVLLAEYGIDDKLWIVGGNIPQRDFRALENLGVARVFPVGCALDEIVAFIKEKTA